MFQLVEYVRIPYTDSRCTAVRVEGQVKFCLVATFCQRGQSTC